MAIEEQILAGPVVCPADFQTLPVQPDTVVDLLRWRAQQQPDQIAYSFLSDGEIEEVSLTYGELDRKARAIGALLQSYGADGGRALLLYPSGLEYVAAFFGCLYAGVVAVPAYPPRPAKRNRNLPRVRAIVNDCQPFVALTTSQILSGVGTRVSQSPDLQAMRWQTTNELPEALANEWQAPAISSLTLAFLQYTSGSTATPKGVMVSHENLLHNEHLIKLAFQQTEQSVVVGWLPLYHDMGLIGNVIQPLYLGARCILMSPTSFLMRPFSWLKAISDYKATTSGGPNFAYELCVRKITAEQRACLDLSSWTTAFNGAEPIREETITRFTEAFESCGFRREAFAPCYGLAEATLIVSGGRNTESAQSLSVEASALERNEVVPSETNDVSTRTLINCGSAVLDQQLIIVDPETAVECAPLTVGEIWVSGPSVTHGYWGRPEETAQTFHAYLNDTHEGPFLRTGDLGFLDNGNLYVTGRLKDLIIIRGRNLYPQDIELTVEKSHSALRSGCGAAFSAEVNGEEHLIVVQEIDYRQRPDVNSVIEKIRQAVAEEHEVQLSAVLLLEPGNIPKTSSGKIQRHACRAKFLAGSFEVVGEWRAVLNPESDVAPLPASLESAEVIEAWLLSHLATRIGVDICEIDVNQLIGHYGMDSLQAIELMHSVESTFGVNLPIASLLQGSTISQIAAHILAQTGATHSHAKLSRSAIQSDTTDHPLSHGQQALWFLYQLAPDSTAYNIANAMRIVSSLDVEALRKAFQSLVERHASLRTTFVEVEGKPVQRIEANAEVCFEEHDASAWDEESLNARLTEESHYQFKLEHGPLFRVSLFRRSANEHILLVVVPHIIADFWSFAVLVRELEVLYQAHAAGSPATLAPLELQYTDYARWQAEMLSSAEGGRLRSYWQRQLSGELPVLDLPFDKQPPSVQTYRGDSHAFKLTPRIVEGLKALSRDHDATLYTVLLASFQVLLHRYSGQNEILVGSPAAGRSHSELAGLVGYFVNPLIMRANLSGNPSFGAFLQQVRETVLGALEHQEYPSALLVEQLQSRETSRPPLYQVMFTLQKSPEEQGLTSFALNETGARMTLGALSVESVALKQQVAQFDLTLMMAEVGDGLAASLQYNTDLFDAATIERMAGNFERLLESIVAEPDRQVSALPMLSETELQQWLAWNDVAMDYPSDACLHELIEAQADRTPDAVAVICDQQRLSYAQLNARANQLAHYLRTLGLGPETAIGICMERSVEMVVGLLGILKAGCIYVPLDPAFPKERLAFMVADARLPVLLTQPRLLEELPGAGARIVCLDSEWGTIAAQSEENLQSGVTSANLAYVIYTSGSTGKPKGAMLPHSGIVNCLTWMQQTYNLTPSDRFLHKASLSFDPSVWELFWPLMVGASVVIAPPDAHHDSAALLRAIVENEASFIYFVPSMLSVFLEEPGVETALSLRKVICGGDALSVETVKRFYNCLSAAELHHSYGPTECSIASLEWVCRPNHNRHVVPIGNSLGNTWNYVLDGEMQPVPAGVPGELYIGGDCVGRGYLNRPELTAERFVPNPFSSEPGARLYKTGDLVRHLSDGPIEFLGRLDHQVKIRGFRIETAEIEAVLEQHEAVREVVVLAREDESRMKYLVAYAVAAGEQLPSVSSLREYLRERLPDYMVPPAFVLLDEWPMMPNGKLDRNALPVPPPPQANQDNDKVQRTPIEEMLTGMWADVLGVKHPGLDDNFFELGGHSLLATQLMSRVRSIFHIEIPLRRLFESPTIAGLAAHVEHELRAGDGLSLAPIRRASRDVDLPLSHAQQRLWFLDQLERGSAAYNMPGIVRLKGPLNVAILEQTLREIVRRHEIWRTTFPSRNGLPVQIVAANVDFKLDQTDLSHLTEAERKTEASRLVHAEAQAAFDLERGPLVRVRLVRESAAEHVLVVVMHHIISDGWSMGVLVREVGALYAAYATGAESLLAELELQYGDYAVWQREQLQGERLAEQLAYWREQLQGAAVLELPADRVRGAVAGDAGAQVAMELPASLTKALQELSRREGVTLFMVLVAAFKVLLARWSGQRDVVVGTPVAGRTRVELEPLLGFFVNTLALRTQLGERSSFRELLQQVREVALGAYAHQETPFELLVEALSPERQLSHTPLFQVLFALQNAPQAELQLGGVELVVEGVGNKTAKFDLTLALEEQGGVLRGQWEYRTELFEAETIERLARHYETLLQSVVAAPEQEVWTLPMLPAEEREQVVVSWNETKRAYPAEASVAELFAEQAERRPEAVALEQGEERVTYRELNERANQLAHYLKRLGVGAEVRVGLCLERSVEMVVGLLGILKAGGVYVPLDRQYPEARLQFMLADTQAQVLLTDEKSAGKLPMPQGQVVCINSDRELIEQESRANPATKVSADGLAYIMYTSGSTGEAKGVCITHRNIIRLVKGSEYAELDEQQVFLQLAPLTFDASTFELWGSLLNGARLVLMKDGLSSLTELGETLRRHEVTTLWLTAGLFHQLVEERVEELQGVRQLLAGGDVLSAPHVRKVLENVSGLRLINGYGPTEGTTFTCTYALTDAGQCDASVPIGKPIANTEVYILDRAQQVAPVGVTGELYIGGDGLAQGYLNAPDLTAEKFVPHPFSAEAGARLYRSGDLARYRADGEIEFLGRMDRQIKLRGFRIELGEVETVLRAHAAVQDALVEVREGTKNDRRLVAYLVSEASLRPGEVRAYLQEKLPEYIIPSTFVLLDAFPLTPNGKVDRRALPEPDLGRSVDDEGFVQPRTPVEEILSNIWSEILGVDLLSVYDNFFELGGHSLLATQLMSRLREVFQTEIPLRAVFESPTIAGLALEIERELRDGTGLEAPPIVPVRRDVDLPLSHAQQRLWFLDQLELGSAAYNMPAIVRLKGSLNVTILEQTLREIFRRHEIWRTTFPSRNGLPVQVVAQSVDFKLDQTDLSQLTEAERKTEASRLVHAEAQAAFDLEHGPLVRVRLVRESAAEHVLVVVMHHIISDGWSMGVLVREVGALYAAYATGAESPLAELELQYGDYAVWQREQLQGERLAEQLEYWRGQLQGAAVLELPTDRVRGAVAGDAGAQVAMELPASLTKALQELSRREGVTLFMVLVAAFKVLLARWSGQRDVVVGTPVAGRTRVELEPLLGFFVNTLALRTQLGERSSFRELLQQVREVALGAYAHQETPFELLVEALSPERQLSHTPLFQVLFALQNAPQAELQLGGVELAVEGLSSATAKFDLTLALEEQGGVLRGQWEYRTELFEAETIERLARHYETLLQSVVAAPEQEVWTLPMLPAEEREQVVMGWNETKRVYPAEASLAELFAEQAERRPEAVALEQGEKRITYRELNERANQLAHYLRRLGVGQEVRVGLCLERSIEMVVGLLGILKAGGVYVPLDRQYPEARLQFMLEDTQAQVLLTRERLVADLPVAGISLVCLDRDAELIAAEPVTNPPLSVFAENLAYVIYTSGSTGRPKGVAITHGSATTLIHWAHEEFTAAELAVVLASTSICFDLSIFELFVPLSVGGTVLLVENALELPNLESGSAVTLINTVPSVMTELLRMSALPESVRVVNLAGEPLQAALVEQVYAAGAVQRVLNLYGPSEDTTYSTWSVVERGEQPNIGRPVANTQVYILDQAQQVVPVGVTGELYIGGAGLARGYLNRAELTAEKFVPDPFSTEGGARLYRTGDVGRYRRDGEIEYLGRADQQVKLRGFRIELGEIEAVLSQHESVAEVAVVAHSGTGEARLVAYVVGAEQVDVMELRRYLEQRVPGYMIPAQFVLLEALPLTPNGKVDRKALPAPEGVRLAVAEYVAPRTETEEALVEIWRELLGVQEIGVHDNFFDLGGHSLLATQLMARVRERFAVEVALRRLFESPSIAALAIAIEESAKPNGNELPRLQPARGRKKVDRLRARIDQLSDVEVKKIVQEKKLSRLHLQETHLDRVNTETR